MSKRPALAKSELEIARIVWDLGEATVRQVRETLPRDRRLDFKTVQTYLRRLKAKGYLDTRREGRSDVYVPRVRPGTVVGEVVDDLISRLFAGNAFPLVLHLLNEQRLTGEEIEHLKELLDQARARGL